MSTRYKLAVCLVAFAAGSAAAQERTPVPPEEFRAQLQQFVGELRDTALLVQESALGREAARSAGLPAMLARLRQVEAAVRDLGPEELGALQAHMQRAPDWRALPGELRAVFGPELRQRLRLIQPERLRSPELPASVRELESIGCLPGTVFPMHIVTTAKGVALAAEVLMELFPTDVLTIILRELATLAWGVAKAAEVVAENLNGIEKECADLTLYLVLYAHADAPTSTRATQASVDGVTGRLDARLDQTVSSRATQASLDNLHAKADDLRERAQALAASVADLTAMTERLAIEHDLSGTERPLTTFVLPASVGGRIELARELTAQAIARAAAAGLDTGQAATELARGDSALAAGRYKTAYDRFRKAYTAVLRLPGDGPDAR